MPVDAASETLGVGEPGDRWSGYDLASMAGIGRENAVLTHQVESRWRVRWSVLIHCSRSLR